MKNYFKKFSIMFVIILAIIGVGIMENGRVANAATVGQTLTAAEAGWARYDDNDSRFKYTGSWTSSANVTGCYKNAYSVTSIFGNNVTFKFYGTKLRYIAALASNRASTAQITIDGAIETFSQRNGSNLILQALLYEKTGLTLGVHTVTMTAGSGGYSGLDAIDIDDTGSLLSYDYDGSISLNQSSMDLNVGNSQQLNATTTPAGTGITWTSSDNSIATVDNTGNVTAISAGQATITASLNDGSNLSASCTVNVGNQTIPTTGITLNKTTDSMVVGQTDNLVATTTPAGVGITWTSSDNSIATVDNTGNVTAISAGQATITATLNHGSNISASCTVNVGHQTIPTTGITLNKTTDSMVVAQTDNLIATVAPNNAANKNVTWSSSDTSIATVDSNGVVTGIKEGTVTITAATADGLTATCAVTVAPKGTVPIEPEPTEAEYIVNTAHAKGDNTNNASGGVSIIFKGVAEAQLSVVKTADVESVYVGDTFTYTIVVTNTSSKTAKAVVINDSAPNHIDFTVGGITTTQGKVDPSSTSKNIIVNVGDIPPSGTVTIKIPATVIL